MRIAGYVLYNAWPRRDTCHVRYHCNYKTKTINYSYHGCLEG